MKINGLVLSFICCMLADAKTNMYSEAGLSVKPSQRKDVKVQYKADKKKQKQPISYPARKQAVPESSSSGVLPAGFINAYESRVHASESEPSLDFGNSSEEDSESEESESESEESEEEVIPVESASSTSSSILIEPVYAAPISQLGRPPRKSSSDDAKKPQKKEADKKKKKQQKKESQKQEGKAPKEAQAAEAAEGCGCGNNGNLYVSHPPRPDYNAGCQLNHYDASSSSSSSGYSAHPACIPRNDHYLSCTKENAIVAVQRVNELFNTLWQQQEIAALYEQAVHPESFYRVREPVGLNVCTDAEGPLFDYLTQPGTFSSYVEKYTYNKATGAITVNVIEVGVANGKTIVRKLKRKYITLRGCEYKLYTVTGTNFQCLDCA